MDIDVRRYVSTLWTRVTDAASKDAHRDLAQKVEQLARDLKAADTGGFKPGMSVFFWGTVDEIPDGWEEATEMRGRFPRGMPLAGTPGATGGSNKHTHGTGGTSTGGGKTLSFGATGGGVSMGDGTGAARTLSLSPHDHDIPEATTLPPYVDGIWIRKL